MADGSLHIPDVPEGSRYPELAEMLGRRAAADASLVVAARNNPNKFVEACGRIEGQVWVSKQAGAHRMWQDHFTRASALPGASTACLLAPVGHGKCVKRGTPVETVCGPVAIEAVQVGERVAVLDPASPHALQWAPVVRTYECGRKAIVKLTTSTGRVLEVASTHPLYVFDEWRRAGDIEVGDQLMSVRPSDVDQASELTLWDHVVAVEQGGEDECFDIEVGHPAHCYLANGVVSHNSQQTTRWRVLYELGRNPNLRVLMLSATSQLPEKMLSGIKADIEHNAFVQAVFPHLRPGRKKGQNSWSNTQIHVERSDHLTDPSIECAGLTTKILGKRADLIAVDDLLNTENTLTAYMRKQVWDRVQAEALSRRPPHLPSRAWFLGHPWTEDDALAQACLQPGSRVLRTGARVQRTSSGRIITSADPEWNELIPWFPLLPELWTKATLQQRMTSLGWASRFMLDCLFMKRGAGGFTPEAIALALMNGRGVTWKHSWNPIATGAPTYTGVDLSTGEGDDETVIFTAARMPNKQRRILEIQAGKWDGPEIVERIRDVHARYRPTIAVESNGFQRVLRQFIRDESAFITPVLDHHTGGNKHALKWGIKAMAMELAPPGQWIFPRPENMLEPVSPEMASLVHGALNFSSDAKHTSDYVMAWWICWLQMAKDEGLSLA